MDSKMTAVLDLVRRQVSEPLPRFSDIVRSVHADVLLDLREALHTTLAALKHLYLSEHMEVAFRVANTYDMQMNGRYDVVSWRNQPNADGATRLTLGVVETDGSFQYQLRVIVDALTREGFTVELNNVANEKVLPLFLPPLTDLQNRFEESGAEKGKITLTVEMK